MTRYSVLLACVLGAAPARADLAGKRQELAEIQKQLELKKREIDGFRRQEYDLHREVSKLKVQTEDSRRKMAELEGRIRDAESKKKELRERASALQLAEGRWRGVLAEELRAYQRLPADDSPVYGARGVWDESFRRAAILEKTEYLEGVRGTRRSTEAAAAEARKLAAQLAAKGQGARADYRTRETLYQRTHAVYRETHGKIEMMQRAIRELQDSALALTRLLRTLETKSAYRPQGERRPPAGPAKSLPWPAAGKVVTSFGRQPLRDLGTVVIHQGIRIATAAHAPVRPVKPGRIIFSGPFRSYGQVLIVDHGQAFYTIYGQLGELRAKKGDDVTPGDVVAVAGEPESRPGERDVTDGGVVYFEVRQSGEALDPLRWLK
ncbi:MAG: peptidoglycan DD-metalloendopeptidase family protein [Elusimicrobia bacterium]|nr:peptidoglycan DD-metalloendopeptidase family protein [Elusimicrobiota bacterium]